MIAIAIVAQKPVLYMCTLCMMYRSVAFTGHTTVLACHLICAFYMWKMKHFIQENMYRLNAWRLRSCTFYTTLVQNWHNFRLQIRNISDYCISDASSRLLIRCTYIFQTQPKIFQTLRQKYFILWLHVFQTPYQKYFRLLVRNISYSDYKYSRLLIRNIPDS